MKTYKRKYKWGTLFIRADFGQASSPIMYSIDSPDDWRATVFQAADAGHNSARALTMVNSWLESQAG